MNDAAEHYIDLDQWGDDLRQEEDERAGSRGTDGEEREEAGGAKDEDEKTAGNRLDAHTNLAEALSRRKSK